MQHQPPNTARVELAVDVAANIVRMRTTFTNLEPKAVLFDDAIRFGSEDATLNFVRMMQQAVLPPAAVITEVNCTFDVKQGSHRG